MHPPPETLPPELVFILVLGFTSHAVAFFFGWGSGRITLLALKSQIQTWKSRSERAEKQVDELQAVLHEKVREALD